MQNPAAEISQVVNLMCCAVDPEVQKQAVLKYFSANASFRHPLCSVLSAPDSVYSILRIYQWYRVMSPSILLQVDNVAYDPRHGYLFLDITQQFHIRFSPLQPASTRLLTRINLTQGDDGLFYIYSQEDFYHPEDLIGLVVPPLSPIVHMLLRAGTIASNINATIAQLAFGCWRPESDGGHTADGNKSE